MFDIFQDADLVYSSVSSSMVGRGVQVNSLIFPFRSKLPYINFGILSFQFAWLAENYDDIRSYFGDSSFGGHVSAMLGGFAADANFPSDIGELEAFLDAHGEDLVNILQVINDQIPIPFASSKEKLSMFMTCTLCWECYRASLLGKKILHVHSVFYYCISEYFLIWRTSSK